MKKMKILAIISTFVLCLGMMLTPAYASEYIAISEYKEIFKPEEDLAAKLTVSVKATAGEDGYIYLIKNVKDMTLVDMKGENISGDLEEITRGGIGYYRVKAVDVKAESQVIAQFSVPAFYAAEGTAEDNGGSNFALTYSFTNYFDSEIGKYNVTVFTPKGYEIVKVSEPAKYDKQKLGVEDEMRFVGAGGKLEPAASKGVAFTYNTPRSSMTNIAIWVGCLAIGGFVFVDRLKKAKQ